jgi:hypothetical protein
MKPVKKYPECTEEQSLGPAPLPVTREADTGSPGTCPEHNRALNPQEKLHLTFFRHTVYIQCSSHAV